MADNAKSSEVMFFLGAGASVAADVPDTHSFVKEFVEGIEEPGKKQTVEIIVKTLEKWKKEKIDVELLLDTLTKLRDRKKDPLLRFYKNRSENFILKELSPKNPLINDLKDVIKDRAIIKSKEKIQYLQPFLGFVEQFRPLKIISLNYDTCIEQFCNVHRLTYQDGFDVYWNPKTFEIVTDIHLYKLHGSVMWYQSKNGGYIKLPVMTDKSKIELITGETAENLMLYPMQKWDYSDPLLELLVESRCLLEKCNFLIVVGYSFRDPHIRRILWDAARKNKELHIILIDPESYEIYYDKLKYYDGKPRTLSSLDGKVICLPYKFEEVFPYLNPIYLKNLREGITGWTSQHNAELRGEKSNYVHSIRNFINAEYTEKAEELWVTIDSSELERDWSLGLEFHLKIAVNFYVNNEKVKAIKHIKNFYKSLYTVIMDRINVEISKGDSSIFINVNFNYQQNRIPIYVNYAENFKNFIVNLHDFCELRQRFAVHTKSEIQEIINYLKIIKNYFESLKNGRLEFNDYIELRRDKISNVEEFKGRSINLFIDGSQSRYEALVSNVLEIERSVLKEIIKEK